MEREIKFRAWDKINSKWVSVGSLDKEIVINPFTSTSRAGQFSISEYNAVHDIAENIGTTIILMQFTGLKDRKGKEIYEGDVTASKCVVKIGVFTTGDDYGTKAYGAYITDGSCTWGIDPDSPELIIGNIHENPELMEPK